MDELPPPHLEDDQPTAVAYLRVSTLAQVNTDYDPEGISLPDQRKAIQQKAAQLGARLVEEYVEPGKSATSMDKRPAFQAMLERIRAHRDVTYVIVYKLSRMNRNRLDDALTLASLRKYKTTLISATESIDQTPVGQLMHGILAAFNEYRSAEDGADIRYKMGEKAKRGGTLGRAKLGYLNTRERFEGREIRTVTLDPDRAPFITLAFELYATGTYSFQALADELTHRGLKGRPGRYPAAPVTDSKIQTILSDRYYLGIVTHPDGTQYPGRHQPLVTPDLFDRVQTLLDATSTSAERRRTHEHYLKGSLWCARCHTRGTRSRLTFNQSTGKHGQRYDYFFCLNRRTGTCDLPHLPTEYVEDAVTRYWSTQRLPEDFTTRVRHDLNDVLTETSTSRQLLHQQLTTELAAIDRKEENLLDLAADGDPDLADGKLRTRLTRLATQKRQIHERLTETDDHLRQGAAVLETQLELLHRPDELYRQLTNHGRRLLNQAIFEELLIDQTPDTHTPDITGQTYTEPVHDLMTAAHPHTTTATTSTNDVGPAVTGGPNTAVSQVALPTPIPQDRSWNKATLVELRRFELLTPSMPWRCATSCATAPPLQRRPPVRPPYEACRVYPSSPG